MSTEVCVESSRVPCSAVVITRNEEEKIATCLKSLRFCDEIIVVDAQSTDRTRELARQYADRVVEREWTGYADQKNFAVSLARHDWIFSIDADEESSPALEREIRLLVTDSSDVSAYAIPRRTIHSGRWIRYGGWYPNRLVRLFKRSEGRWVGSDVHEYWEVSGKTAQLSADIIHYSFDSIADQVDRNNRYSTLGALSLRRSGARYSLVKLLVKPVSKFAETYLLKLGFLDGYPGFIISVSAAYSVFLKWAKLWELQRDAKKAR